jgi:hypothetical protein
MKRLALGFFLLLFSAAGLNAQSKLPDPINEPKQERGGWETYISNEGRYSILFPGAPQTTSQETATPDGAKLTQYMAFIGTGNDFYMVAYFDIGSSTWSFDKARDGALGKVNGTLISERNITLGENPGREVKVFGKSGDADVFIVARFFRVGERIYLLQYLTLKTGNTDTPAQAARCFDSFKVQQ